MPQQKNYSFYDQGKLGRNEWWRFFLVVGLTILVGFFSLQFFIVPILDAYQYKYSDNYWEYIKGYADKITYPAEKYFIIETILFDVIYDSFLLIIFLILFKLIYKKDIQSLITGNNRNFRWKRFFLSFFIIFLPLFILAILAELVASFLILGTYSSTVLRLTITLFPLVILIFSSTFLQVFSEEIMFRGYLSQFFTGKFKRLFWPFIISAILFSAIHLNVIETFGIIVIGFFLNVLAYKEDGLETALSFHLAKNFVAFLFIAFFPLNEFFPAEDPTVALESFSIPDILTALGLFISVNLSYAIGMIIVIPLFTLILYGKKGFDLRFLFEKRN